MSKQRPSKGAPTRQDIPARRSQKRRPPTRRPQRRPAHRSRTPTAVAIGATAVAAVIIAIFLATSRHSTPQLGGPTGPEGVSLETGTPLAAAGAVTPTKGAAVGVDCGATEQLATHTHTHLAVFVHGALRPIPLGVGFYGQVQVSRTAQGAFANGTSNCLYWLHTHAQDGIIHVEAPAGRTFVLGQFFIIWGQPLTQNQVGPATGPVTAYVNGHLWTQPIENIPLAAHENIQLDIGAPLVPPRTVTFPSSL